MSNNIVLVILLLYYFMYMVSNNLLYYVILCKYNIQNLKNSNDLEISFIFQQNPIFRFYKMFFSFLVLISVTDKPYSWPKFSQWKKNFHNRIFYVQTLSTRLSNPSNFSLHILNIFIRNILLHTHKVVKPTRPYNTIIINR